MVNFLLKFTMTKAEGRNKNQSPIKNLNVRHCFVILISSLIIFTAGCGGELGESGGVTSLIISPPSATVGINQAELFRVIAKNSLGNIVSINPAWSVSGGIGSISSTGIFTAGPSSGEGMVIAGYGSLSASAQVTVTDRGWLEGKLQSVAFDIVSGIKVYLQEIPSLNDFSDSQGRFSIANIPPGTYLALTEPTQIYQSASQEVVIKEGETTIWPDIFLELQPGLPSTTTTTFITF
jgi:hypothetical protein